MSKEALSKHETIPRLRGENTLEALGLQICIVSEIKERDMPVFHILNTIAWRFVEGGEFRSSLKRHVCQVMTVEDLYTKSKENPKDDPNYWIIFSRNDTAWILPHENDLMVIKVKGDDWEIKWVLIDLGNSTHGLYRNAFDWLKLNPNEFHSFRGFLVGLPL